MHIQRIQSLDILRGWAILLMVCFHFIYDLNFFHYISVDLQHDIVWVYTRYLIVTLFLLAVGISLALVHLPKIQWLKMRKRTLYLGVASLLVSLATYIQFPYTWVYFGILHFIFLASWVALIFLPYPKVTLLTVCFIYIGYILGYLQMHTIFVFLQPYLQLPSRHTEDLVIFFPWFAVVLIGISLVQYNMYTTFLRYITFKEGEKLKIILAFMGRHALIIYLLHQPILFGILSFSIS